LTNFLSENIWYLLILALKFEFGQENNNTIDATSYGKLTVKLPLGNKQKFTNFAIANKAFKDSHKMDLGALAWVERSAAQTAVAPRFLSSQTLCGGLGEVISP
jgi:hypothetical protein